MSQSNLCKVLSFEERVSRVREKDCSAAAMVKLLSTGVIYYCRIKPYGMKDVLDYLRSAALSGQPVPPYFFDEIMDVISPTLEDHFRYRFVMEGLRINAQHRLFQASADFKSYLNEFIREVW